MASFDHDEGVNQQLRALAGGTRQLLSVSRRRIAQALDALDEGDFCTANAMMEQAAQNLLPLAQAQARISFAATADLIDCADLEEGMVIVGHGRVESVVITGPCDGECPGHIVVEMPSHFLRFHIGSEIYVERGSSDD